MGATLIFCKSKKIALTNNISAIYKFYFAYIKSKDLIYYSAAGAGSSAGESLRLRR